ARWPAATSRWSWAGSTRSGCRRTWCRCIGCASPTRSRGGGRRSCGEVFRGGGGGAGRVRRVGGAVAALLRHGRRDAGGGERAHGGAGGGAVSEGGRDVRSGGDCAYPAGVPVLRGRRRGEGVAPADRGAELGAEDVARAVADVDVGVSEPRVQRGPEGEGRAGGRWVAA